REVGRDAEARREAGAESVLRNVRDPGSDRGARVAGPQRLAANADEPLRGRADARDRLGEFALAVAGNACDRDDLTRVHRQTCLADRGTALTEDRAALDLEDELANRRQALDPLGRRDLPPDHQ